jgi:hypothetical protein
MYNLQEAYLGVYYNLNEAPFNDKGEFIRANPRPESSSETEGSTEIPKTPKMTKPKLKSKPQQNNEELNLYDIILDYLLDEGYADTEEAATVIMANMSEDWDDDIYEEVLDEAMVEGPRKQRMRELEFKRGSRAGGFALTPRDRTTAFNVAVRGDTSPHGPTVRSQSRQGAGNRAMRRRGLEVRDTRNKG